MAKVLIKRLNLERKLHLNYTQPNSDIILRRIFSLKFRHHKGVDEMVVNDLGKTLITVGASGKNLYDGNYGIITDVLCNGKLTAEFLAYIRPRIFRRLPPSPQLNVAAVETDPSPNGLPPSLPMFAALVVDFRCYFQDNP
ncbi:hypothetical protein IEQ34_002816 [Dendrobium chrysotoxum]|uniref:Uncharacterized protein n=1 Tax=Dendrobium chrysotoxum TaxID=161865 RepID=A0AAV7HJP3_DENCH|nr:hypothetical protein IEQ34_002816 [Dendrobium chrysotoxum]